MDTTVPILNYDQIEELNNMIYGIQQENKKKLDDLLSETAEIQGTSILNLYKLVVDEWDKKQKIIDNLCHFSLTMMNTVHFLWDQKQDNQDKLGTAEAVIGSLQKYIDELGEENQKFKNKINEAETHIESISGEKQKFEQLYKSQSCINFADQGYLSQMQANSSQISKECEACGQHRSLIEKQKDDFIKQTSNLKEQKKYLQKKFEELMEEHQLVKMEIELAEIAVKDALSYREQSISNRSSIMDRSDEIFTTKSHAQFMNGQLECFSNLDDSFNLQKRQILANQFFIQDNTVHFACKTEIPQTHKQTQIQMFNNNDSIVPNPFKKKVSKQSGERRYNTQAQDEQDTESRSEVRAANETKTVKGKKTVSLQCSLLKNVPKIKMFSKQPLQTSENHKKSKILKNDSLPQRKVEKTKETKSLAALSKSEIIKPLSTQVEADPSKGSISRFINFISSKIITNRIKVK